MEILFIILIILFIILIWYGLGLLGSHIALNTDPKIMNWNNSMSQGLVIALAGPISFLAGLIFYFLKRR